MRRLLGLTVVMALLVPALAAVAVTESVRDDFGAVSYSGNDGSFDFSGPWSEIGESNGPSSGLVGVSDQNCSDSKCLRITGGLLTGAGASRAADLSGISSPHLEFDLTLEAPLLSTGTLFVEAKGNGNGWTTLDSYGLLGEAGHHKEEFDLSAFVGPDFGLRFRLSSILGGDRVYIDRISIEGTAATTTSTSSTTSSSSSTSSTSTSTTSTTSTSSTSTRVGVTTSTTADRRTNSTDQETTTSTTVSGQTTTTASGSREPAGNDESTNTTVSSSTSTTGFAIVTPPPPTPPSAEGLRDPGVGLMANYRSGMMGEMGEIEVLGLELDADFSIAAELFEVARVWIAILALMLAAALVSGMDWRRSRHATGD